MNLIKIIATWHHSRDISFACPTRLRFIICTFLSELNDIHKLLILILHNNTMHIVCHVIYYKVPRLKHKCLLFKKIFKLFGKRVQVCVLYMHNLSIASQVFLFYIYLAGDNLN